MKLASYTDKTGHGYGAVSDGGIIPLAVRFPHWPTLLDVIQAGGLDEVAVAAQDQTARVTEFDFRPVLPNAQRILCVGVNFPARNAEYKDGSAQPAHMSLFPRFASGFTGHDQPLIRPPESHQLDYEGELAVVIGKSGRRIAPEAA